MTWVAVAIAGSALVGAGASAYSSNKAAKASGKGADQAAGVQQYMYDTTRRDYAPYRQVGYGALSELANLYGLDAPEVPTEQSLSGLAPAETVDLPMQGALTEHQVIRAIEEFAGRPATREEIKYYSDRERADQLYDNFVRPALARREQQRPAQEFQGGSKTNPPEDRFAAFRESPDYLFAQEQGQRAVDQSLAARGLTNSGRAAKELTRFGQGLASQQLQNYTNRLASLAGVGQTATQSLAAVGQNTANRIGGARQDAADARASGYLGVGNAINSGIEQGWGMYQLNRLAS